MKRLFLAVLLLLPFAVQATVLLQSRDGTIGAGYTSPEPGFGVKVSFDSDVTTLAAAYRYKDFKFWAGGEQFKQTFKLITYTKICVSKTCSVIPVTTTTEEVEYGADIGMGYYIENIFIYVSHGTASGDTALGIGYGF